MARTGKRKARWHIWIIGAALLLWYLAGAYTIVSAQHGLLEGITADEAAYYAAQPLWLVIVTDISLALGVAGAIGLLLRKRWCVAVFSLMLVTVLGTNAYELIAGISRVYANPGAAIATAVIAIIAVLQLLYARTMRRSGALA